MSYSSNPPGWWLVALVLIAGPMQAQQDNNNYLDSLQNWSLHFQFTTIVQGHTGFRGAGYDGRNTLSAQANTALSVTTTFFLGRRLWRGAAVYVNPERADGALATATASRSTTRVYRRPQSV